LNDPEIWIVINFYQCIKIKSLNPRVSVPAFLICVPPFVNQTTGKMFGIKNIQDTHLGSGSWYIFLTNNDKNYHMYQTSMNVLG